LLSKVAVASLSAKSQKKKKKKKKKNAKEERRTRRVVDQKQAYRRANDQTVCESTSNATVSTSPRQRQGKNSQHFLTPTKKKT
jgi:hypothetical protein